MNSKTLSVIGIVAVLLLVTAPIMIDHQTFGYKYHGKSYYHGKHCYRHCYYRHGQYCYTRCR